MRWNWVPGPQKLFPIITNFYQYFHCIVCIQELCEQAVVRPWWSDMVPQSSGRGPQTMKSSWAPKIYTLNTDWGLLQVNKEVTKMINVSDDDSVTSHTHNKRGMKIVQ